MNTEALLESVATEEVGESLIMPSLNHGYVQGKLVVALDKLDNYLVVPAVSLQLQTGSYVPDICLFPRLSIDPLHDCIKVAEMPLLAIEILSPTQGTFEILQKFTELFAAGVKSCWLVEPVAGTVMVFSAADCSKTFASGEVVDEALQISLPLRTFFTWQQ